MKKMLFTMIGLAMCFSVSASALTSDMDVTLDASLKTHHMWHGLDMYNDSAALQGAVNIGLAEGFYAGIRYTMPGSGGNAYNLIGYNYSKSDMTQWDYWVGYQSQYLVGEGMQIDYDLSYTYYDWGTVRNGGFKPLSGADLDMQELALDMRLPNACPFGMFVPRYEVAYMFSPGGGDMGELNNSRYGFLHTLGLGYNFEVADMPMFATADIVYDSSVITEKHDWTRAVIGLTTEFDMGDAGKLVPGVYYQHAFLDGSSVLDGAWAPIMDDDFYATLTYSISF